MEYLGADGPAVNFPNVHKGITAMNANFNYYMENMKNVKNRSDCNWTRNQNHLVRKRTLNHLAKLEVQLQSLKL